MFVLVIFLKGRSLTKLKYIIFILPAYLLVSCFTAKTDKKALDCPDTTPVCSPVTWNGMAIDTSAEFFQASGWRYKIQPVMNINTIDNEWRLSFVKPNEGILTYDDRGIQKIISVRRAVPEKMSIEKGFALPYDEHYGMPSIASSGDFAIANSSNTIQNNSEEDYADNFLPVSRTIGLSNIQTGKFSNGVISNLTQTDFTNPPDSLIWDSHPSLSPDGNILFFASDRSNGFGGTDIWYSVKQTDGSWGDPINCGSTVNTACDEITPFISTSKRYLLFASKGHDNVGGFDVFRVRINSEMFSNPLSGNNYFSDLKNIRYPLNTKYDEISPTCPGNCDSIIYYSSNQRAPSEDMVSRAGGFDMYVMYEITRTDDPVLAKNEPDDELDIDIELDTSPAEVIIDNINPLYNLTGTVTDEVENPIHGSVITVSKIPETSTALITETDIHGKYNFQLEKGVNYEITATKDEFFQDQANLFVERKDTSSEVIQNFILSQETTIRISFLYDKWEDPYRYTLDSNGIETGITWQSALENIANDILRSMDKVELIRLVGHTDERGSVEYNANLADKRVKFIKDELVKRGVPAEILKTRSAGELEPLPKREGEEMSLYRKRLRRVTLEKILK